MFIFSILEMACTQIMFDESNNDILYVFSKSVDSEGIPVSKVLSPEIFSLQSEATADLLTVQGPGKVRRYTVLFTGVTDKPEISEVQFNIGLPDGQPQSTVVHVKVETDETGPFEVS